MGFPPCSLSRLKTKIWKLPRIFNRSMSPTWQAGLGANRPQVSRGGLVHSVVQSVGLGLVRAYHSSKFTRHLMDRLNMASLVIQTNMFTLPPAESMDALVMSLPDGTLPTATAKEPVLIETWQKGRQTQVHLMNYADQPQKVNIHFNESVTARVLSPDTDEVFQLEGETLTLYLDIYSILLLD